MPFLGQQRHARAFRFDIDRGSDDATNQKSIHRRMSAVNSPGVPPMDRAPRSASPGRDSPGSSSAGAAAAGSAGSNGHGASHGHADGEPPAPEALGEDAVGVVVIGRNEGERLKRCLRSLLSQGAGPIVYVDSGSSDDSVAFSRGLGVIVVNLDTSIPFTMARGRNAGFEELSRRYPALRWVQFVDGDCEVRPGWIAEARAAIVARPEIAAVCGRRRERHPEASIYNRLADMEWNAPIGEVEASGGDVLFRCPVFLELGGFNPRMIAGEEPELCVRVRERGYKILRIEAEMTLHDAAMSRFSQWWTRATRGGHAFAEGMALHGRGESRHSVRETLSALTYGMALPALFGGALVFAATGIGFGPLTAGVIALVPLAYLRAGLNAYRQRRGRGDPARHAALYGAFCMLGKIPESIGVATYWLNRWRGRYSGLMEYKTVEQGQAARAGEGAPSVVNGPS
jgi:GT2 family glycosyltransferase